MVSGLLMAVVNALAFSLNIFLGAKAGRSIARVSDKFLTPLTPPGYAFGIWSVIYTLQLFFVIYGLYSSENRVVKEGVAWRYTLASLCTIIWYLTFPRGNIEVAAISTILYFYILQQALSRVTQMSETCESWSRADYWLVQLLFAINTAWAFTAMTLSVLQVIMKSTGALEFARWVSIFSTFLFLFVSFSVTSGGKWFGNTYGIAEPIIPLVFLWPIITLIRDLRLRGSRVLPPTESSVLLLALCICGVGCALCVFQGLYRNWIRIPPVHSLDRAYQEFRNDPLAEEL